MRAHGLRQFRNKRYDSAAAAWEMIAQPDARVMAAAAEAHFRQATIARDVATALAHLKRAVDLVPGDAVYTFHLGLAYHRNGNPAKALECYRRAAEGGFSRQDFQWLMALAEIEAQPTAPPTAREGDAFQQALAPLRACLASQPFDAAATAGMVQRLRGIGAAPGTITLLEAMIQLAAGNAQQARRIFVSDSRGGLSRHLAAIRDYYLGVAALACSDPVTAIERWHSAHRQDADLRQLRGNMAAVLAQRADLLAGQGTRDQAASTLMQALALAPGHPALCSRAIPLLMALAQKEVANDRPAAAFDRLEQARSALEDADVKAIFGRNASPRPIMHNLAIVAELLERWQPAAEAWRAMLRTRPRRGGAQEIDETYWGWVRRRSIECYQRAGQIDQAIVLLRRAVKADPADADQHLDLCQALLSNEQLQAAVNELQRLLEQHPQHVEALKLMAMTQVNLEQGYAAEETMRRALALDPANPDMKRFAARILSLQADVAATIDQPDRAMRLLQEAIELTPDDYLLHLALARVAFNTDQPAAARAHLERTLAIGKGKPDAYAACALCWAIERNLDEVRAVLALAETNQALTPMVLALVGSQCIEIGNEAPDPVNSLAALLGLPDDKPKAPRSQQAEQAEALGHELIARALGQGADADVLRQVVNHMLRSLAPAGIRYAQQLTQLTPEDPVAWLLLGVLLGANSNAKDAQRALSTAARLARQAGLNDVARQAEDMKRQVSSPFFAAMIRSAMAGAAGFDVNDDGYGYDDDPI